MQLRVAPARASAASDVRASPAGPRILVDLSHAADGYVGVAQDVRLVFSMLCDAAGLDVCGLLMPAGRHDLPDIRPNRRDHAALTAAVLHAMERNWDAPEPRRFPFSLVQRAQILRQMARSRHRLLPLADAGQLNALWRILFAKSLPPQRRAALLAHDFYATDLSVASVIDRCVHPPVPLRKHLDARGFDAVLFSMPRPVALPRGVRQIIRFHDTVPVTDTDTVVGWKLGLAHSRLVRACDRDAIFVCNSPQSRDCLAALDPSRAEHAVVIPCAVAPPRAENPSIDAIAVINRHLTFRACGSHPAPPGWQPPARGMRYVLGVSTLEPRKNFPGLVRGWERAAARNPGLRLVIVGGQGWREEDALAQMRPGVASGQILHLERVPQDELQVLMRQAACFAFTSFNEGFGYSPLEGMQAGAPCVVSDLPVLHWIFGDAAIYADPYDPDAIAAGIERVVSDAALVRELRARSAAVLARFRPGVVGAAWGEMLKEAVLF